MTQYNKNSTPGAKDDVWESNGEAADANIAFRTRQFTSQRYLAFYVAPKLSVSNDLEKAIGPVGSPAAINNWDLGTTDFSADVQIVATKDFFWAVVQNINHTGTMFVVFVGNLIAFDANPAVFLLDTGGASAGSFVTLPVTSNPLLAGIRAGNILQIVNTPKASTALAESFVVLEVTTTSIVARRLVNSYSAGARVGMSPCPIARFIGSNTELDSDSGTPNNFTVPFAAPLLNRATGDFAVDNGLDSGLSLTDIDYAVLNRQTQGGTEFGSGSTPNNRSLRFTARTAVVSHSGNSSGLAGGIFGRVPGILTYNGTPLYYPHDYGRADRLSSEKDYVPMRFTATSTRHFVIGPTAGS